MIYIENLHHDPHYNLAFEEYVLKNIDAGEEILLLWQNEPSVIIGSFQNTLEEINSDFIERNGINVVRRITGGGAVYHDFGNLNYSLIVPNAGTEIDFKTFTQPLVSALEKMGVKTEQTGRNDITIMERKFSGNAQYLWKNRLLHHGTILFDSKLEDVQSALKVKPGKFESKSTKSVRSRVTNLLPHFPSPITIEEFKSQLLENMGDYNGLKTMELSAEQLDAINELADGKYRQWEWNYGSSPSCNVIKSNFFPCGFIEFRMEVDKGLIKHMKVYGDFFSRKGIEEFMDCFQNVRYDKEALHRTLQSMELGDYFGSITAEEILDTIY